MERCYLERPSAAREADILEYLEELRATGTEGHGTGGLDRVLQGWTFEDALKRCLGMEDAAYAAAIGRCQGKTFLLVRERDRRIMGCINVRWNLTEQMRQFGGHIGYGVRPSEQRQGYAKLMLYLGLKEMRKMGEREVILGCDRANTASAKTILALGGVWERSEAGENEGETDDFYTIDVDASLERFAPVYEPFVGSPMERVYLERPSAAREADIRAYFAELKETGTEPHGDGRLHCMLEGQPFEELLERCLRMEDADYVAQLGFCQNRTSFIVRERDGFIVGTLNVRWNMSEELASHLGHIGAGIRPSLQRQGYGKLALYLGLVEARELGLGQVSVGCAVDNAASAKVIRSLGGVWGWKSYWEGGDEWDDFYIIDVDEALAKFEPVYGPFVAEAPAVFRV